MCYLQKHIITLNPQLSTLNFYIQFLIRNFKGASLFTLFCPFAEPNERVLVIVLLFLLGARAFVTRSQSKNTYSSLFTPSITPLKYLLLSEKPEVWLLPRASST